MHLRYDVADKKGAMTLRRAGRLQHRRVGAPYARHRVLALVDERQITVVDLFTGEIPSSHRSSPTAPTGATSGETPADARGPN